MEAEVRCRMPDRPRAPLHRSQAHRIEIDAVQNVEQVGRPFLPIKALWQDIGQGSDDLGPERVPVFVCLFQAAEYKDRVHLAMPLMELALRLIDKCCPPVARSRGTALPLPVFAQPREVHAGRRYEHRVVSVRGLLTHAV